MRPSKLKAVGDYAAVAGNLVFNPIGWFNAIGLAMVAVAFGVAVTIMFLFDIQNEALGTFPMGVTLLALDLTYRLKESGGNYDTPAAGGSFFSMPAWVIGAFWIILGMLETFESSWPILLANVGHSVLN